MKKLFLVVMVLILVFIQGGTTTMADYSIQMSQRNAENTDWNNIYPITKAANVKTSAGSDVETRLAEIEYQKASKSELQQISLSYKESYATLTDLQAAYPSGDIYNHAVLADGMIYTYSNGWVSTGIQANGTGIADKTVTDTKLEKTYMYATLYANMFNKNDITSGYAMNADGSLSVNASYCVTGYIPIYGLDFVTNMVGASRCALYDANKNQLRTSTLSTYVLASSRIDAYYIRYTLGLVRLDTHMFVYGSVLPTEYVPYGRYILPEDVRGMSDYLGLVKTNVITVGATGDFTTLVAAIDSITNASELNRYKVMIQQGDYDIIAEYTLARIEAQTATRWRGLYIPDYVDLEGIGKVKLYGYLPADLTGYTFDRNTVSVLNFDKKNNLKNLTIESRNMRYCVHSDELNGNINCDQLFDNVTLKVLANTEGLSSVYNIAAPYGVNVGGGNHLRFRKCKFIGLQRDRSKPNVVMHTANAQANHAEVDFEECEFIGGDGQSIKISSAGSGQKDIVNFTGCKMEGSIRIANETNYTGDNEWTIKGHGNKGFTYILQSNASAGKDILIDSVICANSTGALIPAKTPLKIVNSRITPMATGDSIYLFYGIAMQDIANGDTGTVRVSGGVVTPTEMGLTVSLGDKITVANGTLAVTTGTEFIGVVKRDGFITLI